MKPWSRLDWLIIIIFAALVTLFYWRILTPNLADRQSFPPGDFSTQFWAFATFEVRELSAGRLPLWNPYTFAGSPFWADVQAAVFYPPSLLTILLSAPWGFSLFALEIEAIFHFWLAAIFIYLFSRQITRSRAAAVIAALTFTFSGYLTGYPSQQLAVLETDVWLPLILFFIYRASERWEVGRLGDGEMGRWGDGEMGEKKQSPTRLLLFAGVAWGLALLAGHPQSALIVAYVSIAYFAFLWLAGGKVSGVRPALSAAEGCQVSGSKVAAGREPQAGEMSPAASPGQTGDTPASLAQAGHPKDAPHTTHRQEHAATGDPQTASNTQSSIRSSNAPPARSTRSVHSSRETSTLHPPPSTLHPLSSIFYPLSFLLPLALFLATGLALAAIQFLPALEYTLLSVRAEGTYDNMSGGLPITDVIQLLLPGQVSFYSPLYVGVVGLILAGWATFAAPARQRHTTFWAIVALVTFLISLGGNTFLYSPLYLFTPGFSIFRGQERWAFTAAFSLSVLAGYGFRALRYQVSGLRLTQYLLLFALLLTFLFFFGLNDTGWTPDSPFYGLLGAATLLTVLLALAWLLWRFAPRLPPALFTTFTAALICFDLFTANWQTNLYPEPPEWHTQMPAVVEAIKKDRAASPDQPYRVYNEFRLYDNYGVPFEIEDLWGASPLRPDRYDKFLAPPMPIERTWELLNVEYVITWRQELYLPSTIIYQEPAADGTTYVHRLNQVGPRAWLVTRAEIADDPTILQKIADPNFDRWQIALLEPGAEPFLARLNQPATPRLAEPVDQDTATPDRQHLTRITDHGSRITFHSPQFLSAQVETPVPALLIFSETYYPGWQAAIDGQPAPLLRADYVLRAVPLPAGEHTVELTFRPFTFTIGAVISGLTVMVIAAALVLQWVKRKP